MSLNTIALVLCSACLSAVTTAFEQPILKDQDRGLVAFPLRDGSTFPVYQRGDPSLLKTDKRRLRVLGGRAGIPGVLTDTEFCNGTFAKRNLCVHGQNGKKDILLAVANEFDCVSTLLESGVHAYMSTDDCGKKDKKGRVFKVRDGTQKEALNPIPFNTDLACSTLPNGCVFTAEKIPSHLILKYKAFQATVMHGQRYRRLVGRDYTAARIRTVPESLHFWDAETMDENEVVSTRANHFQSLPSEYERISDQNNFAGSHRLLDEDLNLQLKVASVEPRVFEVKNFLSETEMHFLLDATVVEAEEDKLARAKDDMFILSVLYDRVLDLLQIDAVDDIGSVVDVSVDKIDQHTAKEDTKARVVDRTELERFAQVVVFLTDAPGEVVFPQHGSDDEQVSIAAEKGSAVLLYSMLPDGNVDEYAKPTVVPFNEAGEVWIATFTVKDSILEQETS